MINKNKHNPGAEKAVLSSMMVNNGCIGAVSNILAADDFYIHDHQTVFAAMLELYTTGTVVDPHTLEDKSKLGVRRLFDITQEDVSGTNAVSYAEIVKKDAIDRKLWAACKVAATKPGVESGERISLLMRDLAKLEGKVGRSVRSLKDLYDNDFTEVQRDIENDGAQIKTGFYNLDYWYPNAKRGRLTTLGAKTGMGKTSFAMQYALHTAKSGLPVLFCGLEMGYLELWERWLFSATKLDVHSLPIIRGNKEQVVKVVEKTRAAAEEYSKLPIHLVCSSDYTVDQLRAKARSMKGELALVIMDYLQLAATDEEGGEGRTRNVSKVAWGLKMMAMECNVHVLAISQLSRKADDFEPTLSDLRECGDIENHSDNVLLLSARPGATPDQQGKYVVLPTKMRIAKQRGGAVNHTVDFEFVANETRFVEAQSKNGGER